MTEINKEYSIISVKTYNSRNHEESVGSIVDICDVLINDDNSYHLKYGPLDKVILFGDVDHLDRKTYKNLMKEILENLIKFFKIDSDEISYTISKKDNEVGFHWSINKYYCTVREMYQ
jgi:septum formation topological specificity factor MinE